MQQYGRCGERGHRPVCERVISNPSAMCPACQGCVSWERFAQAAMLAAQGQRQAKHQHLCFRMHSFVPGLAKRCANGVNAPSITLSKKKSAYLKNVGLRVRSFLLVLSV